MAAPDPSSALWRGDFMSELLIITGDCILTFSPEIHKRDAQRPAPAGNASRSEVRGNLGLALRLAAFLFSAHVLFFNVRDVGKQNAGLIVRTGR